jgi:hypothetical protein
MTNMKNESQQTERERERAAMVREALRRPGVREVMEVYGNWQRADKKLDAYRSATRSRRTTTTTDNTNAG